MPGIKKTILRAAAAGLLCGAALAAAAGAPAPKPEYSDLYGNRRPLTSPDKVVVAGFWVNNCPYSERTMSLLTRLGADYPEEQVQITGFYMHEGTPDRVMELAGAKGYSMTLAIAQGAPGLRAALERVFKFGAPGQAVYVADRNGEVRAVSAADLEAPDEKIYAELRELIGSVLPPGASFKANRLAAVFPFTAAQNADGARYVWFVYGKTGSKYSYLPAGRLPASERLRPAPGNVPRTGDVAWWPDFMAIYAGPGAPDAANLVTAGGRLSLAELERRYGPVKWYRYFKPE